MTIQINDLNTSDFQELDNDQLNVILGGGFFSSTPGRLAPWHRANRPRLGA